MCPNQFEHRRKISSKCAYNQLALCFWMRNLHPKVSLRILLNDLNRFGNKQSTKIREKTVHFNWIVQLNFTILENCWNEIQIIHQVFFSTKNWIIFEKHKLNFVGEKKNLNWIEDCTWFQSKCQSKTKISIQLSAIAFSTPCNLIFNLVT